MLIHRAGRAGSVLCLDRAHNETMFLDDNCFSLVVVFLGHRGDCSHDLVQTGRDSIERQ